MSKLLDNLGETEQILPFRFTRFGVYSTELPGIIILSFLMLDIQQLAGIGVRVFICIRFEYPVTSFHRRSLHTRHYMVVNIKRNADVSMPQTI